VSESHTYGLFAALAGGVRARHVPELVEIDTDIVGVRAAVCSGGDRTGGTIQPDLVMALRRAIDEAEQEHAGRYDRAATGGAGAVA
jgi:hypothetical protein